MPSLSIVSSELAFGLNFITDNLLFEIKDLEFILATEIDKKNCEVLTQPGILGFNLNNLHEEKVINTNFISQLKKKKLISNFDFFFHFNSEYSGNIIIGSKPHEYDHNTINKIEKYSYTRISQIATKLDWS